MTCALAHTDVLNEVTTRMRTEDQNGTFVTREMFELATLCALDRIAYRRAANTNRSRIASLLLWQDAPERSTRDGYAVSLCVYCGAKHHVGGECTGDALDFDDRGHRREVES